MSVVIVFMDGHMQHGCTRGTVQTHKGCASEEWVRFQNAPFLSRQSKEGHGTLRAVMVNGKSLFELEQTLQTSNLYNI